MTDARLRRWNALKYIIRKHPGDYRLVWPKDGGPVQVLRRCYVWGIMGAPHTHWRGVDI